MIDFIISKGPLIAALFCFLALLGWKHHKKKPCRLEDIIVVFLSGASIPTAILLIYSGFDKAILSKMIDASIYIGLAGVALIYVAVSSLKDKFKS